jgi:hypothetical protein
LFIATRTELVVRSREHVLLVGDVEVLQGAAAERRDLVTHMDHAAQVIEDVLLLRCPALCGEGVTRVAGERTRQAPAVVRVSTAASRSRRRNRSAACPGWS